MSESAPLPRALMLTIAVVQGVLLYALYKAFDANVWPSESPLWSYPLWTLAIAVPVLLLLALELGNERRVVIMTGGFGAVLALLALYTGWQAEPFGEFPVGMLSAAFGCTMTIACFKALMYLQQRAAQVPLTYDVLFTYSWRNFLVLALADLFVLAVWAILGLWGALFKVIEIDFFAELFRKDWFLFPVLSFAFGLGVIIFRDLTRIIDGITRLLQGLMKLLLPLIVLVAVIFLVALPFTGLDVLWATGSGTSLLLWLTALILFYTNAVYQDGRGAEPYPPVVHRLIYIGLGTLPIISALSLYGLVLRLNQYGWTVERGWAFVVWLVLTLFSVGYVWGIVKRRDEWPQMLARVNTGMGLVVLAFMLLANSPILDFRKISLASQLGRVESGEIPLADFDFYYVSQHLARPGFLAIEEIKADIGDSDPALLEIIRNPQPRMAAQRMPDTDKFWERVTYRPAPFDLPPGLRARIEQSYIARFGNESVLIEADLDDDGQNEYMLVNFMDQRIQQAEYYYRSEEGWEQGYVGFPRGDGIDADIDIVEALKQGEVRVVEPRFDHLDVGGVLLRPN